MTTGRRRYRSIVADSARWDDIELRDGDIIISTPAKCGTTWMQMICALLIFRTPDLPAPLATLSPWIDMQTRPIDQVAADLRAQTHRRFLKTHAPLDGIPDDQRVTYIHVARDPRDVALSWDNHMANMDFGRFFTARFEAVGIDDLGELGITGPPEAPSDDPATRFWEWMERDPEDVQPSGLPGMVEHVAAFWSRRDDPNIHLFHYRDLRTDLAGQMGRLATILDVGPPTDELVEAATFDAMKARADELVPNSDTNFWLDTNKFFDKARTGGWHELLDDAGQQRYERLLDRLAPPDLANWLHHGWLQSP